VSEARSGSATIKFGKGFNAPWFVATGTVEEQREQLVQFLGVDRETVSDLNHPALIVKAAVEAAAIWAAADPDPEGSRGGRGRGATPISPARGGGKSKARSSAQDPNPADPWEQAKKDSEAKGDAPGAGEAAPAEPAEDPILAAIKAAPTLRKLQMVATQNRANWNDDYKAAAGKRKAELEAA